jgi:hypothetical protein
VTAAPLVRASGVPDLAANYALAIETLRRNTVPSDRPDGPPRFIRAGDGYPEPWTRDAALNTWGAAALLDPATAMDTLRMVCEERDGGRVVAQDDQWWDQIVWCIGAWDLARTTGDRAFLAEASAIGSASLRILDAERFRPRWGLYAGPSLMQDGISGFPAPPAPGVETDSFVLSSPAAHEIMCLSTNAVYVGALRALAAMAGALGAGVDEAAYDRRADELAAAIRNELRDAETGAFGYFLHQDGTLDHSEEAAGIALVAAFGIVEGEEARAVLRSLHREPFGHVNVWPHFARYSAERPGRHNVMCWPMVMGLVGHAAVLAGAGDLTRTVLDDLARLTAHGDGHFLEIHDARSGRASGGWQVGREWPPLTDQTWSATAYLRLVHRGVVGIDAGLGGLRFVDDVADGLGTVELRGLPWRGAVLDVDVTGVGPVRSVALDGRDVTAEPFHVPPGLEGAHRVVVERG